MTTPSSENSYERFKGSAFSGERLSEGRGAKAGKHAMDLDSEAMESLHRGLEHFRAGDYFAAHDDWEEVWQGLRGRRRVFWQAMIQLVVGVYHLNNSNRKGCESLWSKALLRCNDLAREYAADVPEPLGLLTDLLNACLASLRRGEDPQPRITHFATSVLSEEWFAFQ
jgi:hypothetical protein